MLRTCLPFLSDVFVLTEEGIASQLKSVVENDALSEYGVKEGIGSLDMSIIVNAYNLLIGSYDMGAGLKALIAAVVYALLYFLVSNLIFETRRMQILFICITLAAAVVAAISFSKTLFDSIVFGLDDIRSVPTGTFVNRNHLSAFLNYGIAATMGVLLGVGVTERRRRSRWPSSYRLLTRVLDWRIQISAILILLFVVQFMTQSRGGLLSLVVLMATMLGLSSMRKDLRDHFRPTMKGIGVVLFVAFIAIGAQVIGKQVDKTVLGMEGRLKIWPATVEVIKDHPLTGTGLGSFQYVYPKYDTGELPGYVNHVHNDYLELLSEQGIIGLGFAIAMIILVFRNAIKTVRLSNDPIRVGITIGAIAALAAALTHAFVDFNSHIPANLAYFIAFLAVVSQPGWTKKKKKKKNKNKAEFQPGALEEALRPG